MLKQSEINTFKRVGIPYEELLKQTQQVQVWNRFSGVSSWTTPLIAYVIARVLEISDDYEMGKREVNISDFDRLRYFVAREDSKTYFDILD